MRSKTRARPTIVANLVLAHHLQVFLQHVREMQPPRAAVARARARPHARVHEHRRYLACALAREFVRARARQRAGSAARDGDLGAGVCQMLGISAYTCRAKCSRGGRRTAAFAAPAVSLRAAVARRRFTAVAAVQAAPLARASACTCSDNHSLGH